MKRVWDDTDDRVRVPAHLYGAADDRRISAEAFPPECRTNHHDAIGPLHAVDGSEHPTELRLCAEQSEEIGRDPRSAHTVRASSPGKPELLGTIRGETRERMCVPRHVHEVGRVERSPPTGGRVEHADVDERVRLRERQGIQDPGLHHREHDRRTGHAQRERHGGDQGDGSTPPHRAAGVAEVLDEVLQHGQAPPVAVPLGQRDHAPELQHGVAMCGLGGHATADVLVRVQLKMALDLGGELGVASRRAEDAGHAVNQRTKASHARSSARVQGYPNPASAGSVIPMGNK